MPDGMNVLSRSLERQSQLRQTLLGILAQQQSQQRQQAFTQQQQKAQQQFQTQQLQQRQESPEVQARIQADQARLATETERLSQLKDEKERFGAFRNLYGNLAEQTENPEIRNAYLGLSKLTRPQDASAAYYNLMQTISSETTKLTTASARGDRERNLLLNLRGGLQNRLDTYYKTASSGMFGFADPDIEGKLRKVANALMSGDRETYNQESQWINEHRPIVDGLMGILSDFNRDIEVAFPKRQTGFIGGLPQVQQQIQETQQQDLLQKGLGALRTEDQVPQAIEQQPQAEGFGGPRATLKPVFESIGRITGEQEPEELSPFERFIRRGGIFGGKSKNINTESSILPITTKAQSISKESKIGNVKQQFNNATQLIKEWYGDTAILQHTGKDTAQRFEQLKNDFKKFAPSLNLEEFITSMFGSK